VIYVFEQFRLDARRRLLFCGREQRPLALTTKAFDTLLYLVEHREQLLEKRALLQAIWPDVIVEENNLTQVVTSLRRALGERRDEHRFIVTVPGRGYRGPLRSAILTWHTSLATARSITSTVKARLLSRASFPSYGSRSCVRSGGMRDSGR
jgi:DNA-binding winged helix-turn-helix (wHTH) protein